MDAWADSVMAAKDSLLRHAFAQLDSLRAVTPDTVRDTIVRVSESELGRPVYVKLGTSLWSVVKDILTLALPVITFFAGIKVSERSQSQREASASLKARVTAARLTRRYLLFGAGVLKSMQDSIEAYKRLGPERGGFFSAAYVEYALTALTDFDEIKARMIALEDNDLEESIWQWHMATMQHLRTFMDLFTMTDDQLKAKHGDWTIPTLMFETQYAMIASQAQHAGAIAKNVEKYLPVSEQTSTPTPGAEESHNG